MFLVATFRLFMVATWKYASNTNTYTYTENGMRADEMLFRYTLTRRGQIIIVLIDTIGGHEQWWNMEAKNQEE